MDAIQREIEELSLAAWPALETHLYDGWVIRVSGGYTKRANSVSPLYASDKSLDEKIAYCKTFYEHHSLSPTFKLTSGDQSSDLDNRLASLGYEEIDRTSVQLLDLEPYEPKGLGQIEASSVLTAEWINGYMTCSKVAEKDYTVCRRILRSIQGHVIWATKTVKGENVGFGFGVVNRESVGIYGIYVEESFRKQGIGRDIMEKILEEAKEKGAVQAYLQVVCSNAPAQDLYNRIGFREKYKYWYRRLSFPRRSVTTG